MAIPPASLSSITVSAPLFTLNIRQNRNNLKITMKMTVPLINTNQIPNISMMLRQAFPSVLSTQCFNDQNLPFSQEVKNTEIGHLFEHILLEELCLLKIQRGSRYATFSGVTNWNWVKDPQGTFHIEINATYKDADILVDALDKTLKLVELIIPTTIPQKKKYPLPANAMYLQEYQSPSRPLEQPNF